MDRQDNSQYATENSGVIWNGNLSGDDAQILTPAAPFAHGAELSDYPDYVDPLVIPPTFNEGASDTKTVPVTKPVGVYRPIPTGSNGVITTGKTELLGFELHNTSTSLVAQINIVDGFDSGYPVVFHVSLAAGESLRDYFPVPILFITGCYVVAVNGSVEGNLFALRNEHV